MGGGGFIRVDDVWEKALEFYFDKLPIGLVVVVWG